jgi:1,4-dihydroxy-2-naphthoate polyprenyltransferase
MSNFKSWLLASRPKTLTASIVPIVVGTALASLEANLWHWWIAALSFLAAIFIQIGTNLVNDAVDFKKGADTDQRIGPKRVTQAGIFSGKAVMQMASAFFLLAIACGVPLVMKGGMPIVYIGVAAVILGYAYTAGPFPLAYRGLGEIFVILFFGIIAVCGVFYLHTGLWSQAAVVAGLQVGFHCTVLLAINNLRDIEGDIKVNKRTLPVRFGKKFARIEIAVLALAPFFIGVFWLRERWAQPFLLPWLIFPLALIIVKAVFFTEPSPQYNKFLGMSAALHLIFGILLTIGFLLC